MNICATDVRNTSMVSFPARKVILNILCLLYTSFAIPSRLAVVAKLERYEADTAVSDSEMIYTVGGAYYITPKTRIMLNYAHFSYEKSVSVNELWAMSQIGF